MDMVGSDYGYYGRTGRFAIGGHLPVNGACPLCGSRKTYIECQYDDTPGHRDTSYLLGCEQCPHRSTCTSDIRAACISWQYPSYRVLEKRGLAGDAYFTIILREGETTKDYCNAVSPVFHDEDESVAAWKAEQWARNHPLMSRPDYTYRLYWVDPEGTSVTKA